MFYLPGTGGGGGGAHRPDNEKLCNLSLYHLIKIEFGVSNNGYYVIYTANLIAVTFLVPEI